MSECPLNEIETTITTHLSHGKLAKEIAVELEITEFVTREHIRTATRLARAKNTTSLVANALRQGWIS